MAPFGLFQYRLERTPLSIAVPLDGTEHEMGLRQLERHARRRPGVRTRYRRYRGPFLEYLTMDDLKKSPRQWREFLHCRKRDLHLTCYTVPGSVDALAERLEENLVYYLPNYLQVIGFIILLMLGVVQGTIASGILALYAYANDKIGRTYRESSEITNHLWGIVFPFIVIWVAVLTPIAANISRAILFGLLIVVCHGSLHRAPSELRYNRQSGFVRFIRRNQECPEGASLLLRDLIKCLRNWASEWRGWWGWKVFEFNELLICWKWKLLQLLRIDFLMYPRRLQTE